MNFYFKEWLLLLEELKPKSLAFKILGNQVDKTGKPIISSDPNILKTTQDFDQIISSNIPEANRKYFYPTIAYIYKTNPSVEKTEFSKYLKYFYNFAVNKQMPVLSFDDNGNVTGNHILDKGTFQGNPYDNYKDWVIAINNKNSESEETQEKKQQQKIKRDESDLSDQELIASSSDGKIKVYKANSVDKCIILGRGKSFCISQPGNSNYAGYRSDPENISTFYFVHDDLTKYKDLSIVVVDATKKGIRITDGPNQTGKTMADPYTGKRITSDPDLYFKYLRENGIDTNIFVNIDRTEEEKKEEWKLGKNNQNLDWFKNLSYEDKKKYIIRGHGLSDEQFNWLVTHKFESLLKQYLTFGATLSTEQLNIVLNDPYFKDLKLNYLYARIKQIPNKKLQLIEYLAMPKAYLEKYKEKYGYDFKDYINKIDIQKYMSFPENIKTEIKKLGIDFLYGELDIKYYYDLPENKKLEIKEILKYNKLNNINIQFKGELSVNDFLKLSEEEKKEYKNLFGNELKLDFHNFYEKFIENPSLEFTEEEKNLIDCNSNIVYNILSQPNKNNVDFFINLLRTKCNDYIDRNILSSYDSLRSIFYSFRDQKTKIINLLHLIGNYSKEMKVNDIDIIIKYMRIYLGSSSKYISIFRRFFQNFASKIDNGEVFDRWETDNENKPLNHKDIDNYSGNETLNLFRKILKGSFENIDDDVVMTIKFIVYTIGKQKFPITTRELIKEYVGEQNYKSIFDQPNKTTQASPEQIQQGYTRDSTRESRNYK